MHEATAAGVVGLREIAAAVEEAAGGEVGTLDVLEAELEVACAFLLSLC